ncbi:mast cell protease 1A-like protein [Pitangus sulphuratus]|nr:mast cell protease 1A-like protein [Pitangus sulphuratus]
MCQPQPLLALLLLLSCPWASASKLGLCKLVRGCSSGLSSQEPLAHPAVGCLAGALQGQIVGGHEAQPHSHPYMAYLKLTSKATLNDYVKTISLPKTGSDLPTGTKCSIAGWGLIDDDQATNKLFETKVSIYSRRKCILFYPHLDTGMVCAGSFHELKDSSQGDSGGPLVCNKVAQGIVSFGYEAPPGVYTRISNYLPWIKKVMKK